MTNESKFETLAISSLPLGNGYRCTINLEHHVDVPLPYVNAHVRDFLSACAAFAAKMRDAIDPPPKEESQAPDNPVKVHNNVEPVAWAVMRVGGRWVAILDTPEQADTSCKSFDRMENWVHEVVPLYRQPQSTLTAVQRQAVEYYIGTGGPQAVDDVLRGLLERLGGGR